MPLLLVATLLVTAAPALGQPANDDFAAATPVVSLPTSDTVDVRDATLEPAEPEGVCAPVGHTVWYALTLSSDTALVIDTAGSDYDTVLHVYTGTELYGLELVDCNDDFFGLQARLPLQADAGTTYHVQVGSFGGDLSGGGDLHISFHEPSRRPLVSRSSFRATSASADWFTFQDETFSDTFVNLMEPHHQAERGRPDKGGRLFIHHSEETYGSDSGTFTSWFGFVELGRDEYRLERSLRRAEVTTAATLEGFRCTFEEIEEDEWEDACEFLGVAEVDIDLTWTGHGGSSRHVSSSQFRSHDLRVIERFRSTSRSATVTGALDSPELDLPQPPADHASLSRDSFIEHVWLRG